MADEPKLDAASKAFADEIDAVFKKHKKAFIPVIRKVPASEGAWIDTAELRIVDVKDESPIKTPEVKILTP